MIRFSIGGPVQHLSHNPLDLPPRLVRLLLLVTALVFVGLRLRWVGHLLTWDEAMNLLSVRSHAGGVEGIFASWIERYPPLYHWFLRCMGPLLQQFAERAEFAGFSWRREAWGLCMR